MNTLTKIVCGDRSHDGHGITDTTFIRTNKSHHEIREAYTKGTYIVGFNLSNDIARDYEDSQLHPSNIDALKNEGIDLTFIDGYDENDPDFNDDDIHLSSESFTELYLKICKIGDPDFYYEIISLQEVQIGGYGLFY